MDRLQPPGPGPVWADTICAVATPPGEGGIGIVRISGPEAVGILDAIFRTPSGRRVASWRSHRLRLGQVVDPATLDVVDQVMGCVMRAPRSYTGEDVAEIHAHGGPVPLRRIVDLALQRGARSPGPGEFTMRAFMTGRLDLPQAEAVIDLIRARTDLSSRLAMGQFQGKLSRRVHVVQDELLDWIARLEATIDFPEDDVPPREGAQELAEADRVLGRLDALLAGAESGRILRDGVRIAIIGKPNVGKSSLLNALLGESRAIVTDIPGTTRDSIEEWLNIEGIPMRVADTAGIRGSEDPLEQMGVERSRRHLETCDLALLVFDAAAALGPEDVEIVQAARMRPLVAILNKVDLPAATIAAQVEEMIAAAGIAAPLVSLSAHTGEGVPVLARVVGERARHGVTFDHEMVGGNLRHREVLYRAREHVQQARESIEKGMPADFVTIDLEASVRALGEITGSSVGEEVVRRIFSQFCIGK